MTEQEWQFLAQQRHVNIGALGRIMAHNQQMNRVILQAANGVEPSQPPRLNAEPPRVTVQDIFDYHLLKDNCVYCQKPYRRCPVHNKENAK